MGSSTHANMINGCWLFFQHKIAVVFFPRFVETNWPFCWNLRAVSFASFHICKDVFYSKWWLFMHERWTFVHFVENVSVFFFAMPFDLKAFNALTSIISIARFVSSSNATRMAEEREKSGNCIAFARDFRKKRNTSRDFNLHKIVQKVFKNSL